jgi:hypothetical protein
MHSEVQQESSQALTSQGPQGPRANGAKERNDDHSALTINRRLLLSVTSDPDAMNNDIPSFLERLHRCPLSRFVERLPRKYMTKSL